MVAFMMEGGLTEALEREILQRFGKESLRTGQRELISAVLRGQNALGVLPTGHGKSLCYQAAAVLLGATSLVVSPLIALMRDQVQGLQTLGIAAERFDSSLEPEEKTALLQRLRGGELRLLFVAPESLENHELLQVLRHVQLSLFVVDEAHCVSEWGHSFRPDYLKLPAFYRSLPFYAVMAITATATLRVQEDLCRLFSIAKDAVFAISPYRSNIIRRVVGTTERTEMVCQVLSMPGRCPAIVYTRTRKGTEALAAELASRGFSVAGYHAGMPAEQREKLQDEFLHNTRNVLVATIAFGMGVDKPDVRTVIHYDEPSSPEAYLQESGRGGRDGADSLSLVLMSGDGLQDARNRIYAAEPDVEGVERAVRWLMPRGARAVSLWELGTGCDVPDDVAMRALMLLDERQAVRVEERGYKFYKVKPLFPLATILDGRDTAEKARLSWLKEHPDGEVEDAAAAWNCSYAEAMEQLRECEAAGEWKLTFRQQALYLRSTAPAQPKEIAEHLSAAYLRRREADLQRFQTLCDILSADTCINAALEQYFTGETLPPCGRCAACKGKTVQIPPAAPPPPLPPEQDLPEFFRPNQRKRFLLGLASPGSNSRRLWAHALYGAAAGTAWEEL